MSSKQIKIKCTNAKNKMFFFFQFYFILYLLNIVWKTLPSRLYARPFDRKIKRIHCYFCEQIKCNANKKNLIFVKEKPTDFDKLLPTKCQRNNFLLRVFASLILTVERTTCDRTNIPQLHPQAMYLSTHTHDSSTTTKPTSGQVFYLAKRLISYKLCHTHQHKLGALHIAKRSDINVDLVATVRIARSVCVCVCRKLYYSLQHMVNVL